MMMPNTLNDDNACQQQQDSYPATTSPSSARAFWQPAVSFLPTTFTTMVERKDMTQVRSNSIPMLVRRSTSELQLYQEQAAAEARDYSMFLKVYGHLQQQQTRTTDQAILDENALCMNRLIQTRSRHLHESAKQGFGGRVSTTPHGMLPDNCLVDEIAKQEDEKASIDGGGEIFQLDL